MKNTFYTIALLLAFAVGANAQGTQQTIKGVECRILTKNTGEKIKPNDVITFQAVQKTEQDSILFSTYLQGQPVKIQVRPSTNVGDLMDIFPLLTKNDSAIIKVPVDSIFKGHETERPKFLTKGGKLVFAIKIVDVQTLAEAMAERNAGLEKLKIAEKMQADAYIKKHALTPKVTPSGIGYIITKMGTKPKPVKGDTVEVNYTGRGTDESVFDSSIEADAKAAGLQQPGRNYEPLRFVVGTGVVIPGWDEGLMLLNEGSKAKFIIPSALAYGERGSGERIRPYSTLIFDLELVKVIHPKTARAKPAAKTPVRRKTPLKKRTTIKAKK